MKTGRKKYVLFCLAAMVVSLLLPMIAGASETACSHEWSDWEIWEMPDCTKPGKSIRYCPKCNEQEFEEIPAEGHSWGEWYTEKSATALREGILTRECMNCGEEESQSIPKLKAKAKLKKNITITDKKAHSMSRYLTKTKGDKVAKWTSTNKKVATISSSGKLRARKNGKTTIQVKMKSGVTASCRVTVKLGKKTTQKKSSGGSGSGTVYYTPSGGKYHSTTGCPTLSRSRTIYSASVSEAQSRGLEPCKVCH